jgi:hypothetical protein
MRKPNTNCHKCGVPLYRNLSRGNRPTCKECLPEVLSSAAKERIGKEYKAYIKRWLSGEEDGMRGKTSISSHIKRYLFDKHKSKCCRCGWAEVNRHTGKVPLEVNHKDGDHTNNRPENLELICPNCHSLTSSYRALNMGNGRPRKA